MASPAMENSQHLEEVSEVQEVQGNKSRDDAMDEVEAETVSVRKSFSVYFSLETSVPTNAIIEAFDAAGVDYEDILYIQPRLSSNTWVVAFRTATAKK